MSSDSELPPELLTQPLALVGLTGLNIESNSNHSSIWNSFNSAIRSERPPLNFILFENNYVFPPAKPDRASYEWYIPKGILKRKWMNKHLEKIPGVLVLFYDLEWDDPSWQSKHTECADRLHSIRTSLIGRGTKLVLVLLQNSAPLPSSEDALAADRAATLCQACGLPPKSLFVMPCRSDHLQGYTMRLESAFYELSQSSYHLSSRAVRSHRDQLNRTNHGYLFVRHQFKMAFYHELKQDVAMAHKHYSQSYAYLMELRITDANIWEVKTIAGYIGYKVWKLSFLLNLPREAISHFRTHLEFFRLRVGQPLAKFEHHAWLAAQFAVFGGLFEEAIELGLPAIQTQHPGFYYQQSASHAVLRKKATLEDYASLDQSVTTPMPHVSPLHLEFYGQRHWRPNRLSLEPADMKAELDGLAGLLQRDRMEVDLTGLVVGALTQAVNQFKNHRSPRMKQYLLVQMTEEYCASSNYREALTLLEPLLWDYRKDFWWKPLTSLLRLGLRCAYLSARVAEYFAFAVELCSPKTVNDVEEKQRLFSNLIGILQKKVPGPESDIDAALVAQTNQQWESELEAVEKDNSRVVTTIITNTISSFVEVKATFDTKEFSAEKAIVVNVHVSYTGPVTIQFTGMSIALNNAAYLPHCQVKDVEQLSFNPGQHRHFSFTFAVQSQDIGTELQIASVTLEMEEMLFAYLRCEGPSSEEFLSTRIGFPVHKTSVMEDVVLNGTAEILPRSANVVVNVEHDPPALRGECYPLRVQITNKEDQTISDVELTVSTSEGRIHNVPKIETGCPSSIKLNLDPIESNQTGDWLSLFTQIEQPGTHTFTFEVNYVITSDVCNTECTYKSQYKTTWTVETVQPIECEVQFQTLQFQPLLKVPVAETFVAVITVANLSPFPVVLEQGVWKFAEGLTHQPMVSQLSGKTLQAAEKGNDVAVLFLDGVDSKAICPGSYSLKWKRAHYKTGQVNVKIPYSACLEMETCSAPLHVAVQLPANGYVREPLKASIFLRNTGESCLELDVAMDSNDAFMYAGNKQIKVQIYPGDNYRLMYNLYPLLSGYVAMPPLQLKCVGSQSMMDQLNPAVMAEIVSRYLPTHIYVLPQMKEQQSMLSAADK